MSRRAHKVSLVIHNSMVVPLAVTFRDAHNNPVHVDDSKITWSSSDPDIAVFQDGKVTPTRKKNGYVTIACTTSEENLSPRLAHFIRIRVLKNHPSLHSQEGLADILAILKKMRAKRKSAQARSKKGGSS